ncbi:MAG: FkbM family methyltransferase [Lachnospiraceae bacterium]|nr:FkbM family methyltransferase [Lachnospiraceae bacterium]
MDDFMNEIKLIYDKMADTISQEIFINKLVYSLTGHVDSLKNVIRTYPSGKDFIERLDQAIIAKRKICIFGTGTWGKSILNSYPDVNFFCFVDNDLSKCGRKIGGLPVIHFNEWIKKNEDMTVIISTKLYHKEIYAQLVAHRISDELIINAGEMINDANRIQYFDLSELKNDKIEDEVFVDAGAFDGQSSAMFALWAGKYKKIFALEPDPQNREKCKETLKSIDAEYEILPFGAWDRTEELSFVSGLNGASHIENNEQIGVEKKVTVQVDKLDNLIHEKISFIKMDIEGAEINALKGAEKMIKTYKPKLAICVYHKKEDIWEIPRLILSYVPEYKLYLRHYSLSKDETVLYCIV